VAGTSGIALAPKDDPRVYVRILTLVREQIADGTLEPGEPTPPIGDFCEQFGCARTTAGKAMRKLAKEGLVVRYPGLGYYVSHRSADDPAPRKPQEPLS
jgi:GntR family transcriptional regulator, histidine utilization repressor